MFLESSPATRSFKENRGDAVTVTRMNVGDPVTATGEGSLTYSLENTDTVAAGRAVSFDIVPSSGQIRTKSGENYDYEAYETRGRPYEVTVTATDPHGNSASITVGISVEDVDEPPLAPAAPSVASGPNPDSDTSLSVNWSAPDNAGRPHITDYDVQYRRQGTSGNWTPKSHTENRYEHHHHGPSGLTSGRNGIKCRCWRGTTKATAPGRSREAGGPMLPGTGRAGVPRVPLTSTSRDRREHAVGPGCRRVQ